MDGLLLQLIAASVVWVLSGAVSAYVAVKVLAARVNILHDEVRRLWALHTPGHPHAG